MQAALLPDRGVVKVDGADARRFLNGLLTSDIEALTPETPRFAGLLTPQGKILFDGIVAAVPPEDGTALFIDCPRALAPDLVRRLNFYKLRAKVIVEDLSEALGLLAVWDGTGTTDCGLVYPDPRLPALGLRVILQPHLADAAARDLGASLVEPEAYEAHRIALGVPRGGVDFAYGDAFPHEADMDQLNGVDFDKGCYVGQEVVSRIEHRARARSRIVPVAFDEFAPEDGVPVMAGERAVGTMGSAARGRGLAMLRLDRAGEALAAGASLSAGGVPIRLVKPAWARFAWPGEATAAE
jgi:folate-binding protein YgfZ